MMSNAKKRKLESEKRKFNNDWTSKYLFVEYNNKSVCLICQENISCPKEYNLRRHFETKHDVYKKYSEKEKDSMVDKLKMGLSQSQNIFRKGNDTAEAATRVSYQISREIAVAGRPFTEGPFVKKCMILAVREICPEKQESFNNVSLSRDTVQRRISDIATNICDQLKDKCGHFEFYSLAFDESCDIVDTAQLLVFIRGINAEFEVSNQSVDFLLEKYRFIFN
jgi:hypothetical protein